MATSDTQTPTRRINSGASQNSGGNSASLKNEEVEEAPDLQEHPLFSSPFLSGSQEGATAGDLLRQSRFQDQNQGGDSLDAGLNAGIGLSKAGKMAGEGVELAGTGLEAGGKIMQGGGEALQAGGKGVSAAGKGVRAAGQATAEGGSAITEAGTGLSETGYGAILGVPLAIAGGAVTGVGEGAQVAGEAMDVAGQGISEAGVGLKEAGKGVEESGKGVKQTGKEIKETSDRVGDTLQQAKDAKQGMARGQMPGIGNGEFGGIPAIAGMPGINLAGMGGKKKKESKLKKLGEYADTLAELGAPVAGQGEAETSDALRQKKTKAGKAAWDKLPEKGGGEFPDMSGMKNAPSIDQMGAMLNHAKQIKKQQGAFAGAKAAVKDLAQTGMQMATGQILKLCWENLIDSYGLTLIYINFHAFCTIAVGKEYFARLGSEWGGGMPGGGAGKAATASKSSSFFGIPLGPSVLEWLEFTVLILIDLLIVAAVFISLLPYIIILIIVTDPTSSFSTLIAAFAEMAKLFIH